MKIPKDTRRVALAAALAVAFAAAALAAAEAPSPGAAAGETRLVLNQGKKWQTDATLRLRMRSIRAALAANLQAIHAGQATGEQYRSLAAKVSDEVSYIVQNCELPPDADAQLHLLIGEVMAGAEAMQGEANGAARRAGAERVARALNRYGELFDHPGWQAL